MSSGWPGSSRLPAERLAEAPSRSRQAPEFEDSLRDAALEEGLRTAVRRTSDHLLGRQHPDGYWVGELEGDTILESEYILLLAWLGRERSDTARQAANYILEQQLPEGGWAIYPGGPLEVSASVKAYFALKLTGHSPDAESMVRARQAILAAGGAERVNSFTRYYLALLGIISYEQCPAVPPELVLIPRWMPFNLYEMSAWSRTILVPLSLLWAHRPVRRLPPELGIRELFTAAPEDLPVTMAPTEALDPLRRRTWLNWDAVFRGLDRGLKLLERCRLRPLRKRAIRRAAEWMIARFEGSNGLGAIFPPIIWSVVALRCLGYAEDAPQVQAALRELEALGIREGDTLRLEPCKSPVWDTAITVLALREADLPPQHPALQRAIAWLLSKEVRRRGDWSVRNPEQPPGGWYFEFNNEYYPDVDDTSMVVMALRRCLSSRGAGLQPASPAEADWSVDFLLADMADRPLRDRLPAPGPASDASAVLEGRGRSTEAACRDVEHAAPLLGAIARGARWVLAMQSRNGGWGAFDADNDRELFTRVPFADHNAMIDPAAADLTGRMLEMLADLGVAANHPAAARALDFVWSTQEPDFSWYGRWGVNYIYGTWQCLVGLTRIGVPADDARLRRAAEWLKSVQQPCGGWGESPASYDDPALRGQGPPTASQTAWALMGLMAADETESEAVRRGVRNLLETQREDGTWDEPWYTGTGFPRVFYLKYHLYRIYFPLMALGRYARLAGTAEGGH